MILLVVLALITGASVYGMKKSDDMGYDGLHITSLLLLVLSGGLLALALVVIPISQYDYSSKMQQYYVIKESIEESRTGDFSEVERAALTTLIIETNTYISDAKYANEHGFDIYVSDEFAELDYLK